MRLFYILLLTLVYVLPSTAQTATFVKVTSQAEIVDGGEYILVAKDGNSYYAASKLKDNVFPSVEIVNVQNDSYTGAYNVSGCPYLFQLSKVEEQYYLVVANRFIGYDVSGNNLKGNLDLIGVNSVEWDILMDGNGFYPSGGDKGYVIRLSGDSFKKYSKGSSTGTLAYLYKKQPATQSVTVGTSSYASFCSTNALDFSESQMKAYIGTIDGDELKLIPVGKVPANTGLILRYDGGITEDIPLLTGDVTPINDNALCAATENVMQEEGYTYYVLGNRSKGVGFYPASPTLTIPAGKAYLRIHEPQTQSEARSFSFNFANTPTSIESLQYKKITEIPTDATIYNLQGQKVSKPTKGLFIVDGKKMFVR